MNKEKEHIKGFIPFKCHPSQKKLVYEGGHGLVSDKCPKCGRFVLFDLDKMDAEITEAVKGAVSKMNNRIS